jgi:hypothetical protein
MAMPKNDDAVDGVVFEKSRVERRKRTTMVAPRETARNVVSDDAV